MAEKTASGEEAVAIVAAVARFEAEHAGPAPQASVSVSAWQRAALVEGVGAKETIQDSRGGSRWLS